jgi:hypothetical protein
MTARADFSDEEWAAIVRAPLVAGMAITLADPGGPIEVVKETAAVVKVVGATAEEGRDGLVGEVAREVKAMAGRRENPVKGFKPDAGLAGKQILDELARVHAIVAAKATPEETEAFSAWLLECAQRAAEAAKEGGFLGWHAVRVSEGEQHMLDELRGVLAPGAAQA